MKETVGLMVAYNVWANKRIAEILKPLDAELLDKPVISSFPSIRKTVYHLWDAEFIWLKRLEGESLDYWPSKQLDNDTSIESFVSVSENILELARENNDDWLNVVCNYSNMKGHKFSTPRFQVLLHVMNHSTFHRGQLVTMLRNVGVDELQPTDLIAYLRHH